MALEFCQQCLSNSVVLSLLSLICNCGNLTPEKIATLMKSGLLLVDSKLEVYQEWRINKEMLVQFIYKPT